MDARLSRLITKHKLSRLRASLEVLSGPAYQLKPISTRSAKAKAKPKVKIKLGATKLGGLPHVHKSFRWPRRGKRPLTFIAQLNLAEFAPIVHWPAKGHLLFFFDVIDQPWGFDPKHRTGHAIIYIPPKTNGRTTALAPAKTPSGMAKTLGEENGPLHELPVRLIRTNTLPPPGNHALHPLAMSEREQLAYANLLREYNGDETAPIHHAFGWPHDIQGDMEEECQLAFHGTNVGFDDPLTPRDAALMSSAQRWQLQLQVSTDDALGVMFGDMGKLYFFTTAESRADLSFKESWAIVQCG